MNLNIKTIQLMLQFILSLLQANCQVQSDSTKLKRKNLLWFVPSGAYKINGVSLGLVNMPDYYLQTINGLSLELIGGGYVTLFLGMDDEGYVPKSHGKLRNNGIIIGTTLFSGQVNGLSCSALIGTNYDLNGCSVSLINATLYKARGMQSGLMNSAEDLKGAQAGGFNYALEMQGIQVGLLNVIHKQSKGLQLGLVNLSKAHRGFQLGLWNKNEKRALPFINWQFS